jgi:8-amino-7-oxononanoate synthase
MADKFDFIRQDVAGLKESGLFINLRIMGSPADAWMIVDGKKVLNFCTNNYLGLANHPRMKEAARKAVEEWGVGPAAVRSIAGTQALHVELERRLAEFKGVEDALYVQSGFCANQAALAPLVGRDRDSGEQDVIFSDRLNHASIIEGCRLAGGETFRYKHNDLEDLERILEKVPDGLGKLIVADGVFSAEGTIVDVAGIVRLARQYNARVMIDEAHSIGVYGSEGRGICDAQGQLKYVDLIMGTFSKSFGGVGGFVAGPYEIIMWIKHKARPMIFSASLPPASVAGVRKALDIIRRADDRREAVLRNAERMGRGLREIGFDIGRSTSQIIPLMIGEDLKCVKFWRALFDAGVFTNAFIQPATPPGGALIRTSYMPTHTEEMLDESLSIMGEVGKKLKVLPK